ncbi:MAG: carboxymuconolactone decarboxylase family protein [Planctomycetota bacterium]|jgi:4-carboxymuconolactone decarboxylase
MEGMRTRHLGRITAAAAAGRRENLVGWYRAALADGVPAADLQEATLQVFLFAGYPRAINAFEELVHALGEHAPPPPQEPEPEDLLARGRETFARIYGPHADAVLGKLDRMHPEFARYILRDAYGQVLGRPFLSLADRELMAVAMLAALGPRRQLSAHVRGCLRVGLAPQEVRRALAAAEEAVGELIPAREVVERGLRGPE